MSAFLLALFVFVANPVPAPAAIARAPARRKVDRSTPQPGPDRPVKITSQTLEVLEKQKQVVWKGDVLVVRDDMKINCDALVGDYDDQKKLKKLTCRGHAHMRQAAAVKPPRPEREAWGDLAVFDNETAILVVTGSPHAREGENTFQGDKVTFNTRADRLRAEGHVQGVIHEKSSVVSPGDGGVAEAAK